MAGCGLEAYAQSQEDSRIPHESRAWDSIFHWVPLDRGAMRFPVTGCRSRQQCPFICKRGKHLLLRANLFIGSGTIGTLRTNEQRLSLRTAKHRTPSLSGTDLPPEVAS